MELLESSDPKEELIRRSARSKAALEEEVKIFAERTEKIVTNALIFGGVVAASYLIYRGLSRKSKTKRKARAQKPVPQDVEIQEAEPSPFSSALTSMGTVIASQAAAFLLAMAKEKLMEYLRQEKETKHGDS